MLEQMSYEFMNLQKEVNIIAINKIDAESTQEKLASECSFVLLQDTDEVDAWGALDGGKDDFYIYAPGGQLAVHLPARGEVATDLSSGPGYANVRDTVLALLEETSN